MALDIQTFMNQIPRQIDQRPVHMVDALGKPCSFYLDFIRSADVRGESRPMAYKF